MRISPVAFATDDDGFCLRIILYARGETLEQARVRWGLGLARVQQALLFVARELRQEHGAASASTKYSKRRRVECATYALRVITYARGETLELARMRRWPGPVRVPRALLLVARNRGGSTVLPAWTGNTLKVALGNECAPTRICPSSRGT